MSAKFFGWLVVDTILNQTVSLHYSTKKMASDWLKEELESGRLVQLEYVEVKK
jgi:hypothetical protein